MSFNFNSFGNTNQSTQSTPQTGSFDFNSFGSGKGSTQTNTTSLPTPLFAQRAQAAINQSGNRINDIISGSGEFQGQSAVQRGVEATATGLSTPLRVAFEALPDIVRKGITALGTAAGTGVNAVADKIGSSKALQNWVLGHPATSKAVQEVAGTAGGLGEIAGDILAYNAVSQVATKATDAIDKNIIQPAQRDIAQSEATQQLKSAVDITKPVLNKKDTIASFRNAGKPGGVGSGYKYEPSQYDLEVADSVKDLVSRSKGPLGNISSINQGIASESQQISQYLSENKAPFNFEDFRSYMEKVEPPATLKTNAGAFEKYGQVRENILSRVYNYMQNQAQTTGDFGSLTDYNQIWDARKVIDNVISDELGTTTFDSPQYLGVKAAARDFRNQINKFVADAVTYPGQMEQVNQMYDFVQQAQRRGISISTPREVNALQNQFGLSPIENNASTQYLDKLSRLSKMYDAVDNIAEANYKLLDKGFVKRWIIQNPGKAKVLETTVGGTAIYALLKKLLGGD